MALTRIESGLLANTAVTSIKVATGAITGDKIGLTAINANNIVDGTITNAKLATPSTPFTVGKAIAVSIVFG
jgi:hypothetical protein